MRSECSSHAPREDRRGFTLIEMLVVMAVLSVFLSVVGGAIWATLRIERADAALFDRISQQSALADQFRADVAGALEAPQAWDAFQASPSCLILRQPGARHLVYQWDQQQLLRTVFSGQEKSAQVLWPGADPEMVRVEFVRPGPRLCLLRLGGLPGPGSTRPRFQLDIAAAVAGETQ